MLPGVAPGVHRLGGKCAAVVVAAAGWQASRSPTGAGVCGQCWPSRMRTVLVDAWVHTCMLYAGRPDTGAGAMAGRATRRCTGACARRGATARARSRP